MTWNGHVLNQASHVSRNRLICPGSHTVPQLKKRRTLHDTAALKPKQTHALVRQTRFPLMTPAGINPSSEEHAPLLRRKLIAAFGNNFDASLVPSSSFFREPHRCHVSSISCPQSCWCMIQAVQVYNLHSIHKLNKLRATWCIVNDSIYKWTKEGRKLFMNY
jgi:hypothetical protein